MANIFKTTLKKDVIADIANNNVREIRFPITKFWATRLADEYNLDEKEFTFKIFDALELSSPSNKDAEGATYTFEFIRTFVDGEEFVVEFKDDDEGENDCCPRTFVDGEEFVVEFKDDDEGENDCCPNVPNDEEVSVEVYTTEDDSATTTEVDDIVPEIAPELPEIPEKDDTAEEIVAFDDNVNVSNEDMFDLINDWFEDENVLNSLYDDECVFSTNARQVIILPKGRILGSKRILPVNNDVEIRIEFDMSKKIYFDSISDFDIFEEEVFRTISEIKKNNFVFIWKRYTGIFMDNDGRAYFGIKYSTRKSIGFNRRYNVQ